MGSNLSYQESTDLKYKGYEKASIRTINEVLSRISEDPGFSFHWSILLKGDDYIHDVMIYSSKIENIELGDQDS